MPQVSLGTLIAFPKKCYEIRAEYGTDRVELGHSDGRCWGQPGAGIVGLTGASQGALMPSGGENPVCQHGNINDAYVVTVTAFNNPGLSRYISAGGQGACVVLPITVLVGTQIKVTGVLQDTTAISGARVVEGATSTTEDCFDVEGFSLGLAANSASEYDPLEPANIINVQGYGFFWYDSDNDLKPGPYSSTVVGCSGKDCSTVTTYYNTDNSPSVPPNCAALSPLPYTAQNETLAGNQWVSKKQLDSGSSLWQRNIAHAESFMPEKTFCKIGPPEQLVPAIYRAELSKVQYK